MFTTTGSLTWDVANPSTSLGGYLRATFPNSKPLQAEYKAKSTKLLVDTFGAPANTIGAAIDLVFQIMLYPGYVPEALLNLFPFDDKYQKAITSLCQCVAFSDDKEEQARAAWVLGLTAISQRAGRAAAPFVWDVVEEGKFDFAILMFIAEKPEIRELTKLRSWGEKRFTSKVKGPLYFGPTFDLSHVGEGQRIAAEADLIANGSLIDVKTTLGRLNSAGERPDALPATHLYQVLAYALLDYSNSYEIQKLGLYSARYGRLTEWPLEFVTSTMAGRPIDLSAARQTVWDFMQEEHNFI